MGFNDRNLLLAIHGFRERKHGSFHDKDIDGLYETFRRTQRITLGNNHESSIFLRLYLIGLALYSFLLLMGTVDMGLGFHIFVLLNLASIYWGRLRFKEGFARMILGYFKNQRILNDNAKLLLLNELDEDFRFESNLPIVSYEDSISRITYHSVHKVPMVMITGICLGILGPISSLIGFVMSMIFSIFVPVLLIQQVTLMYEGIIRVKCADNWVTLPKILLLNLSCIDDKDTDLRSYLFVARSLLRREQRNDSKISKGIGLSRTISRMNPNNDDRVWDLHFKDKILREILNVNDRYHSHSLEMIGDNLKSKLNNDESIESKDFKELLDSNEILDRLDMTRDNDLSVIGKDPYLAGILLDALESNWRNYHRQWIRRFAYLCRHLTHDDFHPSTWEFYGFERRYMNPYNFEPRYPNSSRDKIQFCIDAMMPYQSYRWNLIGYRGRIFT